MEEPLEGSGPVGGREMQ
jgi:hypothetical protein